MSEKLIKGEKFGLVLSIIVYVASLIFFGIVSESPLFLVFAGLLPFLLFIGLFFYSVHVQTEGWILWLLPLLFPALFLLLFGFIPSSMDVPTLAVINVMLSYLINVLVLMIIGLRHVIANDNRDVQIKEKMHSYNAHIHNLKSELNDTREVLELTKTELDDTSSELKTTQIELHDAHKKLKITRDNFSINLRSIEDKCKAINFVIGRVYSDKKGANPVIREQLRIDTEWYNAFSEISAHYKDKDADRLIKILDKIHKKLLLLEQEEEDLFKIGKGSLPVLRQEKDTILDILARNDKDPIEHFHSEAKEICSKLISFLQESSKHIHP